MSSSEVRLWAESGGMALTGYRAGPPQVGPGTPATQLVDDLDRFRRAGRAWSAFEPVLPDHRLIGERAAETGFARNAPWSCGGAFRTVPTADGWIGFSLARPSDEDLIPALVGRDGAVGWPAIEAWAGAVTSQEAHSKARLLGLASALARSSTRPGVTVSSGGSRGVRERPLVVDLTALWAGPLCAHLLGLVGADVVKVESRKRPDGARLGTPRMFEMLHGRHRRLLLDFDDPGDRRKLVGLLESADLVIEASRPRALRALGVVAEDLVAGGVCWVSISAQGRDVDAVGFGDDVAVGAGLCIVAGSTAIPCGDALADPLAGVAAAVAASEALGTATARLIDVSMHDVAAQASAAATVDHLVVAEGDRWYVEADGGRWEVRPPSWAPR